MAQVKEQILSLLSDAIMLEDWDHVREAYKLIKGYTPEKAKVRVSQTPDYSEEFESSPIPNKSIAESVTVPEQPKLTKYGKQMEFYDDREQDRGLAELGKEMAKKHKPTSRRPPEQEMTVNCIVCDNQFKMFAREAPTRSRGGSDGRNGYCCNACAAR